MAKRKSASGRTSAKTGGTKKTAGAKKGSKSNKKPTASKSSKRGKAKNSLVENINKRKKAKTSRSKKNSTVSADSYDQMQQGWPDSKKSKRAASRKKASGKKKAASGTKRSKTAAKKAKRHDAPLRDPRGGLTAAGRKAFNRKEGSHLKPGVKGPADTPEKMRRKGSFLRRHFATLRGPLKDEDGNPTRLALQAQAWGEPVPKTKRDAQRLARKGSELLERYARASK